jgi:hypothetical protein
VSGDVDLPGDDDRTADLAAVLGMPDDEFALNFGAGWRGCSTTGGFSRSPKAPGVGTS